MNKSFISIKNQKQNNLGAFWNYLTDHCSFNLNYQLLTEHLYKFNIKKTIISKNECLLF